MNNANVTIKLSAKSAKKHVICDCTVPFCLLCLYLCFCMSAVTGCELYKGGLRSIVFPFTVGKDMCMLFRCGVDINRRFVAKEKCKPTKNTLKLSNNSSNRHNFQQIKHMARLFFKNTLNFFVFSVFENF